MHFKYKHLDVFRAVMLHGSATHAALELNITQSAVSRILKEFEGIVGFRLFDRMRTGLRPTREAQQLLKDVQRAYRAFSDVNQTARSIQNKEGSQLRVAALAVYVDGFVSRRLSDFRAQYPSTKIQLISATKPDIEKMVATEQVDLGITTLPIVTDLVTVRNSVQRSAVCIFPKGHSLSFNTTITLTDLLNEPLIHLVAGSPLRTLLDSKFLEKGLEARVQVEMETQRAIVNMVSTEGGIGVVDPDILSQQERDQLGYRPLTPPLIWSVASISHKNTTPSQITEEFLRWLHRSWIHSQDQNSRS